MLSQQRNEMSIRDEVSPITISPPLTVVTR
jgi:hypothetical protein